MSKKIRPRDMFDGRLGIFNIHEHMELRKHKDAFRITLAPKPHFIKTHTNIPTLLAPWTPSNPVCRCAGYKSGCASPIVTQQYE
jgi:hypothetical protein